MSLRRGTRTGRGLRCAAVVLGPVVLGSLVLAACGSVPAPTAGAAGAAPTRASGSPPAPSTGTGSGMAALCQDTATVTSLRIVRIHGLRVPQRQTGFPTGLAAIGPAGARAVARELCALPVMPRVVMSCPAMFPGTSYQLRFTAPGRSLPAVTIEATGCATVTGVGQVRQATSAGFWRVLATAAGLSPRGREAFSAPGCELHGYPTKTNGCPGLYPPTGVLQPGGPAQPAG